MAYIILSSSNKTEINILFQFITVVTGEYKNFSLTTLISSTGGVLVHRRGFIRRTNRKVTNPPRSTDFRPRATPHDWSTVGVMELKTTAYTVNLLIGSFEIDISVMQHCMETRGSNLQVVTAFKWA